MRSVKNTLGRLDIAPNARKGRWLVLTTEAAIAQEMIERNGCAGQSVEAPPANGIATSDEAAEAMPDENDRLIELQHEGQRFDTRDEGVTDFTADPLGARR